MSWHFRMIVAEVYISYVSFNFMSKESYAEDLHDGTYSHEAEKCHLVRPPENF